jgi:DNA-binding GntR family transcriptional regulator
MEIQYQDLSYEVYKRLKAMILSNELLPGEQLKQEHIAARLGISRMPLHKAFQMLENEMLVENLPRRGFFVTRIDNNNLSMLSNAAKRSKGLPFAGQLKS